MPKIAFDLDAFIASLKCDPSRQILRVTKTDLRALIAPFEAEIADLRQQLARARDETDGQ